ncbi:M48 family metallopeptidase [Thauera butanivorans]|uniref:M48 family metallopeptidase n=1 Tax=Thauera butanivorans TaxID=86174 RepID=UPI000838AB13|nr:SprT family zinc-dependent metalloprotease [Thauera butanivorans]
MKHARSAAASEEAHRIELGGQCVELTLRRSPARRTLALQIDHRGARVSAPLRTPLAEIDAFIRNHAAWLLDRLGRAAELSRAPVVVPADGCELPLFGRPMRLRIGGVSRAQWRPGNDGAEELHLPARADAERALLRALQGRALAWYRGRVEEYCLRLALPVPPVRLSNARTRWGSCSSLSGIRLHWRLVHLPPELIDYVVAHEVAHLREMNHSPRFWAVVESVCPAWRTGRARLRQAAAGLPVIGAAGAAQAGAQVDTQVDNLEAED